MKIYNTTIFLLLAVHIALLSIMQFTAWPEMLTYPYLLDKGFAFYGDIIHPYFPTLPYVLLFFFKILGFTPTNLQFLTMLIIMTIDLLFWSVAKTIYGQRLAAILLGVFIPLQVLLEGNGLWFDLALVPILLLVLLIFVNFTKQHNAAWFVVMGLLLGVGFTIKQTAIVYGISLLAFLFVQRHAKAIVLLAIGFCIPIFIAFMLFPADQLFFWAIAYPLTIASKIPGYVSYPTIKQAVFMLFLFSPMIGVVMVKKGLLQKFNNLLIIIWFVVSVFFVFPRFAYFHLQPALPFFLLLLPVVWGSVRLGFLVRRGLMIYAVIVCFLTVRFIMQNAFLGSRFFEKSTVQEATLLQQKIPINKPIFFYNTPSNYMVAGNFIPSKPWSDTFPWYLELPGMQELIINHLEEQRIATVIFQPLTGSGQYALGSYTPQKIDSYISTHFRNRTKITPNLWLLQRSSL